LPGGRYKARRSEGNHAHCTPEHVFNQYSYQTRTYFEIKSVYWPTSYSYPATAGQQRNRLAAAGGATQQQLDSSGTAQPQQPDNGGAARPRRRAAAATPCSPSPARCKLISLDAMPEAHTTALGTPQHVRLPASEIYVAKLLRHLTAIGDTA